MLRSFLYLLFTATFVLVVFATGIAKADTVTNEAVASVQLSEQEHICFDMINALRDRAGLSPFVLCPDLIDQSRRWSANMRSRNQIYHGASQEICAQTNTDSGERAFHLWNNSPPHRAFLYRNATKVGIGLSGNYWTMRGESAVQEQSAYVVQERVSVSPPVAGFYYVPLGTDPSTLSSAEWLNAYIVVRTATSSTHIPQHQRTAQRRGG